MTTYIASADASGIKLSKTGGHDVSLNWNHFQNQMTAFPITTEREFIRSQTEFNYFDSIKDGTPGRLQNSLGIYNGMRVNGVDVPRANRAASSSWNTTGSNIKHMRNQFTHKYLANIKHETWLKLKNSNNYLDPPKIYNYHFWDAGMTAERILKSSRTNASGEPQNSIELASIGTLIDPASGKTEENIAHKPLFPMRGNNIQFDRSFMNAIGFRGDSYINATSQSTRVPFIYRMNVGCGTACGGNSNCLITNGAAATPVAHLSRYTIGNNAKGTAIAGLGSGAAATKEKVKLIVLKEWGDKMQVMCHLMNYYLGPNGGTTTLLTNDFPVFCLCLNFQLPCIFTGQTEKKIDGIYKPILPDFKRESDHGEGAKARAYGILEFVPGDPVDTLCRSILQIRTEIYRENQLFLDGITQIRDTRRQIKLGGSNLRLRSAYWNIMIADINAINTNNQRLFGATAPVNFGTGWWNGVCPALDTQTPSAQAFRQAWQMQVGSAALEERRNIALGKAITAFIEEMKKQAYIKRVVKNVKYTANGEGRRGTNSLKLMRFKTYTGYKSTERGYTFGFSQNDPRFGRRLNFSEWAMSMREGSVQGGGAKMKGGMNGTSAGETKGHFHPGHLRPPVDVFWSDLFPGDFQGPVLYYEGENDEPGSTDAVGAFMPPNTYYYFDLTNKLFNSLIAPLYQFKVRSKLGHPEQRMTLQNVRVKVMKALTRAREKSAGKARRWLLVRENKFKALLDEYNETVATIYSQYCYESWIDGQAAVEFIDVNNTTNNLLNQCELRQNYISSLRSKIIQYFLQPLGTKNLTTTRSGKLTRGRQYRRVRSRLGRVVVSGGKKTRKKKRRRRKKHKRKTRKKR